ncbi:MAG: hypothetical protein H6Q00_1640 [Holophagaceae bacterium]|nr:hypothetical protein [Holophagaceae bacterium]
MTKHQKCLNRLGAVPTPSDFTWDELVALLNNLGYRQLNGSGSRRKFYHEGKDDLIVCHSPHPHAVVKRGCLRDVADHLKACGFME